MNTNPTEQSGEAPAERVKQAEVEKKISRVNVAFLRLYGCFGGFVFGFVPPIVLLGALAIRDQMYSKPGDIPSDIDMANPTEFMFLILSVFLSPLISAVLGAILCPLLFQPSRK